MVRTRWVGTLARMVEDTGPRPNRRVNGFVALMLRSPLTRWTMGATALITVTGRKTGRTYTTPVNYLLRGQDAYIISRPERTWWRNLRQGGRAILLGRGRERTGTGEILLAADPRAQVALDGTRLGRALARKPDGVVVHLVLDP